MDTPDRYLAFADQVRRHSPLYHRLAKAVAADGRMIALLDQLPEPKRQPNLLFAAARLLGGPTADPAGFPVWASRRWEDLVAIMLARRTQTNEPGRCATLLPILSRLPQPLALLEVGASAGLCLFPDRYRYRYGGHEVGPADSPVRVECESLGPVPLPDRVPTVVWRAGLDLNPLDLTCDEDLRWLDALIWPEHHHRRDTLRAAAEVARADPPRLVRGDLLTDLPALAAQAPADATLVIFHSAVLCYVSPRPRAQFVQTVRELGARWISNEGYGIMPEVVPPTRTLTPPEDPGSMVVALDGRAVAFAGPHGRTLHWLDGS